MVLSGWRLRPRISLLANKIDISHAWIFQPLRAKPGGVRGNMVSGAP